MDKEEFSVESGSLSLDDSYSDDTPIVCVTDCTGIQDRPEPTEDEEYQQPVFTVVRDVSVKGITMEQITANNLELDSDISNDATGEVICQNRGRFITNFNFSNAGEINRYLRYWGKIPQFLEIRLTETKGYGVFTLTDIAPDTPIGLYQGIHRSSEAGIRPGTEYLFHINNFSGEHEGVVDGENLTYANFSRFINHNEPPNCKGEIHSLMVTITSIDLIPAGTELTITYGKKYWEEMAETH